MSDIAILISTCDKYSDLWQGHIKLLKKYWSDNDYKIYLVTDIPREKPHNDVNVIAAGLGSEITHRIRYALDMIQEKYIFVTLDDYFLIKEVSSSRINDIVNFMDIFSADYVRLFHLPSSKKRDLVDQNIYKINLYSRKSSYYVNLYPGLWRKSFLYKTVEGNYNAWQYEVRLTKLALEHSANCFMINDNTFQILDVVRKGKILSKAYKFFKKNPDLYYGNRDRLSRFTELKIFILTSIKRIVPRPLWMFVKKRLVKKGKKFYSDVD